jgi:murein DD-endopeptidase MepM/ murein hydrolase activator NlpD
VCALLIAAAALSSLPTVSTVAGGAGPSYGTRVVIGGLANNGPTTSDVTGPTASAAPSGLDYYAGDIAIPNILAGPEVASNGAGLLTTYVVQAGDTLGHIAAQFGISGTTLYWANKNSLPDSESIHVGQRLIVPPGDGLVIAVSPTDTIHSLAAKYEMTAQNIVDANHLSGPNIVTGQTLYIPGASGGPIPTPTPIPTPKPTPKPQATSVRVASGGPIPTPKPTSNPQATTVRVASGGGTYAGGAFSWPVVGGRNYVSQYFSSYHHAIDIAAAYGTPVVAAASGVVVRAGWDSYTQGGNVIWISDGTRLYTTYNHLSAWTVKAGQSVSAGERIGSIGTSGDATGPHLHFEVWLGYPWALGNNSNAVNPCIYLAGC